MAADKPRAVPTDPESEACYDALVECVRWEISARIPAGDDPTTPEGQQVLAQMISDTVLDHFVLRPRVERRYHRWSVSNATDPE